MDPLSSVISLLEVQAFWAAGFDAGGDEFVLAGDRAERLLSELPPVVHIQNETDKATLRWCIERMRQELSDPQPGGIVVAQQLATLLLVQTLRLYLADEQNDGAGWLRALADPQLAAAITAIHDQPGEPWTVGALAARAGMSRTSFAVKFKAKVGAAPLEYLTRWRMAVASDQLLKSSEPVAAIARALGYESQSAFGLAFKRVMGCSPRQYARARDV